MRLRVPLVLALAALAPGCAGGSDAARPAPHEGAVLRVVDGDTVRVLVAGVDESVRLIGIDTPETVRPGAPVECFGREASAAHRRLVAGRRVRLEFDVERRDRYGRLLAYVVRRDDGLAVNEALVRDGYATPLTVPPNVRFAARFRALAREARAAGRGLWASC